MEAINSAQKASRPNPIKSERVPYSTNFYKDPPYDVVTNLEDFEAYAQERLKVLRIFETAGFKLRKHSPQYNEQLIKDLGKDLRQRYVRQTAGASFEDMEDDKKRDVLSHFILQMVFCRSEDQRRWLIQQECDLFRFRLGNETGAAVGQFLADTELGYTPLPPEDFINLQEILQKSTFQSHTAQRADTEFYKMDFLEALHLVRQRHVFLNQGYAFVPRRHLVEVITTRFREHLSLQMAKLARTLAESQEDTRLIPLFNRLACGYSGKDYSVSETDYGVSLQNLNQLALESFPLCARNMHDNMRKDHHLRHWARLQYMLFLKGVGLPMDDTSTFFRTEFAQHGVPESGLRQLAYSVRHSYGKEGRRTSYTPPSCMRIIISSHPPSAGEHHGCPYKHFAPSLLTQRVKLAGLSNEDTKEIVELASKSHYQHACTRYFEAVHTKAGKNVDPGMQAIEHPNQYFEESRRLLHPDSVKDKPPVFSRRTTSSSQNPNSMQMGNLQPNSGTVGESLKAVDTDISEFDLMPIDEELLASLDKLESDALANSQISAPAS